ncbi:MAG: TonB-dependent receptor [Candidatus Kapabacteria bacterium]|nr:TonB-dependent receptor [Candidatus Kapabacteria bacterium]
MRNYATVVLLFVCAALTYHSHAQVTVAGTIVEQGSKEVVIGATVALHQDSLTVGVRPVRGGYTNRYGYYSIGRVMPGRYAVVVTSVGYATHVAAIVIDDTSESLVFDVALAPKAAQANEVRVVADRQGSALQRQSTVTLAPSFIKEMPALGGEVDVFRVLQLLPGVKSASEISSGLYVRGGSPDQNLVLLDGVTVYNPSHLGGFLSTFHADALRDVKLIKGAFPAEYGGRLSSVLDITMKEGNAERIKGSASISLIASGIALDGPIDSTTTFMVSGRRFYLDALLWLGAAAAGAEEDVPNYYFYDLNLKVNKRLGDRDRLYVSGYFGRDVLASSSGDGESIDIGWGNRTANLRWTHLFSPDLFSSSSLIFTDYEFGTELISNNGSALRSFGVRSNIQDVTLRSELQWAAHDLHAVKMGFDVTHHAFASGVTGNLLQGGGLDFIKQGTIRSVDAALYLQDEWTITDAMRANVGGRLYWFQQGGWVRFEPRASLSYDLTQESSITASFALAHQFLHLIVRNDVTLPTDVWFPSTANIQPGRSIQGVLGYQTSFDEGTWRFTAETYYKGMSNLYEYRDDAEFTIGVPLESQFTAGTGTAYGIEFFLQKQVGDVTCWLGYTLAWTSRTFPELNNGKPFTPRYDRRHDISLALQYRLAESWRLGLTWQFATGAAYTVPSAQYVTSPFGSSVNDLYTERNGFRLAPFHKMDVNLIHEYSWFGLPWEASINVYNIYNRRNPFALFVSSDYDAVTNEFVRVMKQITLFPIIPTLALRCTF